MNTLHGLVSRRGTWRESFAVFSAGGQSDPTLYAFKVRLWQPNACGIRDYGWSWSPGRDGLAAATDDGTGRLVGQPNASGLVLTWAFPLAETQRLEPGGYVGSITAALASDLSDVTEIAAFRRVVR